MSPTNQIWYLIMQSLFEQLTDLRNAQGSNDKKIVLACATEAFKKYLQYVLDPYKRYFLRDFPEPTIVVGGPPQEDHGHESLFKVLDMLAARQYTGNDAKSLCTNFEQHGGNRDLLLCALTKDLRAGVGAKIVNDVFPNLIPEFLVALAEPYDPSEDPCPLWISTKYDGLRCLAFVNPHEDTVHFKTRNGLDIPSVPKDLADELLVETKKFLRHLEADLGGVSGDGYVFDGEILTGDFLESVSALRKKKEKAEDASFHIFYVLRTDEFFSRQAQEFHNWVIRLLEKFETQMTGRGAGRKVFCVPEELCLNHEEVMAAYQKRRDQKLEGVIAKKPNEKYQFRRSRTWTKIKACDSFDLKITGIKEGKGKYKGMCGALLMDYNGKEVSASGMTDAQRVDFWKKPPVGEVAEVLAQEVTRDGALRHIRFVKIRWDK